MASLEEHQFGKRGCSNLHSLDLRPPSCRLEDVTYHIADLTDATSISRLLEDVRPDIVIHTSSPKFDSPMEIMYKVNVEGARALLQVAKESGVSSFVYTSSASVISDAKTDLKGADEAFPVIPHDQQPEFYVHTKAVAETDVLSQNRAPDATQFLTCAIRPSGIFGVGDLVGKPPLTRTKVRLSCMTRYFCIGKAKKRLGYKPLVGLQEGLRRAVEDSVRRCMPE